MDRALPKGKTLIDLQDDDLTLARAYADAHVGDFDDSYLHKLEVIFREHGSLSTHQWNVLQRTMDKYEMDEWANRGNR